jgi:hypothetical protein
MLTWNTKADYDDPQEAAGMTFDGIEDHGTDTLERGYLYGGNTHPLNTNGLVGWWPLHEQSGQANDLSGNDNHGTVSGATQGVSGIGGLTAYDFDGNNDFVDLGGNTFTLSNGDPCTLSIWFQYQSDDNGRIFNLTNQRLALSIGGNNASAGNVNFRGYDGSSYVLQTTQTLTDGNWYHLTGAFDGSTGYLYVDGSQVDSGSFDYNFTNDISSIGGVGHNGSDLVECATCDARIYNRALNNREIHQLYQYGTLGRDLRKFTVNAI